MCRGFAFLDLISTDANLGKCMNLLNGCSWKGGKLHISQAKPNRFKTLENGQVSIINESSEGIVEKEKKIKKKRKLVRMAGDQNLVTDKNVDSKKGWRRGRYGRAIACLRIRKPNRQLLIIDPSHYKNSLEKLFGSVKPKPVSQLSWTITCTKESANNEMEEQIDESLSDESVGSAQQLDEVIDIEMEDAQDEFEENDPEIKTFIDNESEVKVCDIEEPEFMDLKAVEQTEAITSDTEELDNKVENKKEIIPINISKPAPVPEPKFEVNVNWSSLFNPTTSTTTPTNDSPLFGAISSSNQNNNANVFSLNSLVEKKLKTTVTADELFKKFVPEETKTESIEFAKESSFEPQTSASSAISSTLNKKPVHNYAHIFGDLNRITPTTATRFGMHLSQKEDMLQEWRIERIELKEDFKKRLAEGKRRNKRNKPGKIQ